jgi:hypothetical protein
LRCCGYGRLNHATSSWRCRPELWAEKHIQSQPCDGVFESAVRRSIHWRQRPGYARKCVQRERGRGEYPSPVWRSCKHGRFLQVGLDTWISGRRYISLLVTVCRQVSMPRVVSIVRCSACFRTFMLERKSCFSHLRCSLVTTPSQKSTQFLAVMHSKIGSGTS